MTDAGCVTACFRRCGCVRKVLSGHVRRGHTRIAQSQWGYVEWNEEFEEGRLSGYGLARARPG